MRNASNDTSIQTGVETILSNPLTLSSLKTVSIAGLRLLFGFTEAFFLCESYTQNNNSIRINPVRIDTRADNLAAPWISICIWTLVNNEIECEHLCIDILLHTYDKQRFWKIDAQNTYKLIRYILGCLFETTLIFLGRVVIVSLLSMGQGYYIGQWP